MRVNAAEEARVLLQLPRLALVPPRSARGAPAADAERAAIGPKTMCGAR